MATISRTKFSLGLLVLSLVFSLTANAQQKEQTVYTYVATWQVQRAHWGEFEAAMLKNAKPVFDRLMADGTLVEWGFDTTELHTLDGMTHSSWWVATSQAAIVKTLDELMKMPENPASGAVTKHRDLFLRSLAYNIRMGGKQPAYDTVSSYMVKPGKSAEWLNFFNTFDKPIFDQLLADGTIQGYGVDEEDFHTDSPGERDIWVLFTDPSAMDKVDAAFEAARSKVPGPAVQAVGEAFNGLVDVGAHRDDLSRIISYAHK